jgi:hypothetical protein
MSGSHEPDHKASSLASARAPSIEIDPGDRRGRITACVEIDTLSDELGLRRQARLPSPPAWQKDGPAKITPPGLQLSRENGGDEPAAMPNVYAAGSYFNAPDDAFSTREAESLQGMLKHVDEIAAAMRCLDDFMAAFNARDLEALDATFNFPSVRLASNTLTLIQAGHHTSAMFEAGALRGWSHSAWERREVIHAGPEKVHFDTRFIRYDEGGEVMGGFDSIYVVTREAGHWGIKARSSFAP